MTRRWFQTALLLSLAACCAKADLKKAMEEQNLEKRSQLALDNAEAAYKTARADYDKGDLAGTQAALDEILESVELAQKSLKDTGKDPRKSPKWFKRAEMRTRDLGRRIEAFQEQMSFSDRPMIEKLKTRVQQIHDDLLLGLMEGRKNK